LKEVCKKSDLVSVRTDILHDIALKIEGKTHKPDSPDNVELVSKITEKAISRINNLTKDIGCDMSDKIEQEICRMEVSRIYRQELALQLLYISSQHSTDIRLQIIKLGLIGLGAVLAWQMVKHNCVEDVIEKAKALANEREEAENQAKINAWNKEQENQS